MGKKIFRHKFFFKKVKAPDFSPSCAGFPGLVGSRAVTDMISSPTFHVRYMNILLMHRNLVARVNQLFYENRIPMGQNTEISGGMYDIITTMPKKSQSLVFKARF
jgi:hypothetical protein